MIITKNIYIYSRNTKLCIKNKFNIIHRNYPGPNAGPGGDKWKIIKALITGGNKGSIIPKQPFFDKQKSFLAYYYKKQKDFFINNNFFKNPLFKKFNFEQPKQVKKQENKAEFIKKTEQVLHNSFFEEMPFTYAKLNGNIYKSSISENTTVNDISDDLLRLEMSNRDLTKLVDNDNSVTVLSQNDEKLTVGKSDYKFTVLGQAYSEKYDQEHPTNLLPNAMESISQNPKFILCTACFDTNKVFSLSAKQKHLLCVYSESEDKYYIIGYLTSKLSTEFLSDQQFKDFESEKEGFITNNGKKQYVVFLKNVDSISSKDIKIVKWGEEYLKNFNEKLKNRLKEQQLESMRIFDNNENSKEKCLEICKMYDEICAKKGKHPLTQEQEIANQLSKIKNEEESKKKELLKNKIEKENNKKIINEAIMDEKSN